MTTATARRGVIAPDHGLARRTAFRARRNTNLGVAAAPSARSVSVVDATVAPSGSEIGFRLTALPVVTSTLSLNVIA